MQVPEDREVVAHDVQVEVLGLLLEVVGDGARPGTLSIRNLTSPVAPAALPEISTSVERVADLLRSVPSPTGSETWTPPAWEWVPAGSGSAVQPCRASSRALPQDPEDAPHRAIVPGGP